MFFKIKNQLKCGHYQGCSGLRDAKNDNSSDHPLKLSALRLCECALKLPKHGYSTVTMRWHYWLRDFGAQKNIFTLPYPPFSPGLAQCNFFLLQIQNLPVKGYSFGTVVKMQSAMTWTLNIFHCNEEWHHHWTHYVQPQETYFEGDWAKLHVFFFK